MTEVSPNGAGPRLAPSSTLSHAQAHLRQKRARSQLSCTPCRTGKLKCNRANDPACDQCIKRNREDACKYAPPPAKSKPPQNVKGRIRQLENLVVNLMEQQSKSEQNGHSNRSANEECSTHDGSASSQAQTLAGPHSEPTPPSDIDISPHITGTQRRGESPDSGVDRPFGQMKISKDEISYHGESHWRTILDSISDLKRELADGDDAENDQQDAGAEEEDGHTIAWQNLHYPSKTTTPHAPSGLGFMLGSPTDQITKDDLIKALPDKRTTDRLLSLWFNSADPFKPIIHAPTFQHEYRQFWRDPTPTPVMWIGLLYSILSLAESYGLRSSNPDPECLARTTRYHTLASSAAVLADFTKPKQHTLECLLLFASGMRSSGAFVNVWLTLGLVVRLALRMGYHRDPSHYSSTITPFAGEMRRRVWATISMMDVLVSFQLGLPSMIRTIATDTQPPSNLLDRDFNESSASLPPPRGIDDLTPSSYIRAKVRLVRIFAQAAELSHATIPPCRNEISSLDSALETAHEAIPPLLQFPQGVTETAEQLMCTTNLDLLYLKTKTVLHRRYMHVPLSTLSPTEQELGVGTSRRVCISSALRVLRHHQFIHAETQPNGKLETLRWYMGSISTHDFLLAAMVLCLELSMQINEEKTQQLSRGLECPRRMNIITTLEQSMAIWSQQGEGEGEGEGAAETRKAGRAMGAMLRRVRRAFADNVHGARATWGEIVADGEELEPGFTPAAPELLPPASSLSEPAVSATPDLDFLNSMLAEPMAMDWTLWDSATMQQPAAAQEWEGVVGDRGGFGAVDYLANGAGALIGDGEGFGSVRVGDAGDGVGGGGMSGMGMLGQAGGLGEGLDEGLDSAFQWQEGGLDGRGYGSEGLWGFEPSWLAMRADGS